MECFRFSRLFFILLVTVPCSFPRNDSLGDDLPRVDNQKAFSSVDASSFLTSFCSDCHLNESRGDGEEYFPFRLDEHGVPSIRDVHSSNRSALVMDDDQSIRTWIRVLEVIRDGEMPPAESVSPSLALKGKMIAWLDQALQDSTTIGGTPPRRLSREEYRSTIESIFGIKSFELPAGFPVDRLQHGFDNLGQGLVLSPALMETYSECARLVADQVFPPIQPAPKPTASTAKPEDLVISYSSSKVVGDVMRLGMKCDPIQRSCTWPSRIEAKVSGVYEIVVRLSSFKPGFDSDPMVVKVFARDVSSADSVSHRSLRLLQKIEVTRETEEEFKFEAELYEGQTIVLHWANATLDSDREDKEQLQAFFESKQKQNPKYLAAWHAMLESEEGQGFRGGIGWDRVKVLLKSDGLPEITQSQEQALLKKIIGNPVLFAETVVFDVFENGPALEIHDVEVNGPIRIVDGPREENQRRLQQRFFGGLAGDHRAVIERFLSRVFRRPPQKETLDLWVSLFERHLSEGYSIDESMHLVIRNSLISPRFLYRCLGESTLDPYDLATRLSYFLTLRPPDEKLLKRVDQLTVKKVLRAEAERMIPVSPNSAFIKNFTEQWLDTRRLDDIMPERSFKISRLDQQNAKLEVEYFFAELLRENRPIESLVAPDFTWTSPRIAKNVYELDLVFDKNKMNDLQRFSIPRGGRFGGIVGMSAVMIATANGVDTQPVTRGVWFLEKVLGQEVPPPPDAVPPITPDTQGAMSPRDLLEVHVQDSACSRCHRRIDPYGFVLENFDPVGHWRERWPKIDQQVEAVVKLSDGSKIKDVTELKQWLVSHPEKFGSGFAKQLMVYATGRPMSFREQREIDKIVEGNLSRNEGIRDLFLDLICSSVFAAR
ncbi:DUF1588 domain-containing protein [Rhodopirellula sp.]|nr:DUF1588 domain-containing protein [Rhodopirellula sp.]